MHNDILLKIKPVIEAQLKKSGYCLVDLRFYKDSLYRIVLEILVDRFEGGITLDETARISRELGGLFEETQLISIEYVLEVASPGLDRPLSTANDFNRAKGERVRVFLKEAVEGRIEYEGVVESVGDDRLMVKTTTKTIGIPYTLVNKAKRVIL